MTLGKEEKGVLMKKFDIYAIRTLIILAIISFLIYIPLSVVSGLEKKELNQQYKEQIELHGHEVNKFIQYLDQTKRHLRDRLGHHYPD